MPLLPLFTDECFLISPIGAEGTLDRERADEVREFIVQPAVAEAGLQLVRADDIAQPGDINQQVIEHCVYASAVVADLTGLNANVFYELGIRHASGGFAIMITEDPRLPFDVAALRAVFFDRTSLKSAQNCREQITAQLTKALADPPKPIVDVTPSTKESTTTTLDVLRQSADQASSELVNYVAERLYEIEVSTHRSYDSYNPYLMVSRMRALCDLIKGDLGQHLRLRVGLTDAGPMTLAEVAESMEVSELEAFTHEARLATLLSARGVEQLLADQDPWTPGAD